MLSTEFILTSLVVVLMPGTGVLYTISTGLFLGQKSSIAAALGCTAGIIPHLLASILGLSAIIHISAVAFQIIKLIGAGYLIYLAWSTWHQSSALKFNNANDVKNLRQIAIRGFLINILNPKLSIFFLAFLPLFVSSTAASPMLQLVLLSIVFMIMTLVIFIMYGILAHRVRRYILNSPHMMLWLQRSFAAVFATMGVKLAMTDQ